MTCKETIRQPTLASTGTNGDLFSSLKDASSTLSSLRDGNVDLFLEHVKEALLADLLSCLGPLHKGTCCCADAAKRRHGGDVVVVVAVVVES